MVENEHASDDSHNVWQQPRLSHLIGDGRQQCAISGSTWNTVSCFCSALLYFQKASSHGQQCLRWNDGAEFHYVQPRVSAVPRFRPGPVSGDLEVSRVMRHADRAVLQPLNELAACLPIDVAVVDDNAP